MDVSAIIGGVVGSLVTAGTALAGALMLWRKLSHRIKQESDASALLHYEGVIKRLNEEIDRQHNYFNAEIIRQQAQIDRQSEHIRRLEEGLEQSREEESACRNSVEALWGYCELSHQAARRNARKARLDPDDHDVVPPLPQRPTRTGDGAEFRDRSLKQISRNLEQLKNPPTTGSGQS